MRVRRPRRGRGRGQSVLEFALVMPLLVLTALGATDLAQGYYLSEEITGAARAGMRAGVTSDSIDLGDAIRAEPNTAIPNTDAAWGNEGPPVNVSGTLTPQPDGNCSGTTTACGDPNGCAAASSWQPGQVACFAVRSCKVSNVSGSLYTCTESSPVCASSSSPGPCFSAWQVRPAPCAGGTCSSGQQGPNGDALDVVVAYRFTPSTVKIASYVTGGVFNLRSETEGLEVYY